MQCPLFRNGVLSKGGMWQESFTDCLKDECAWWVKNSQVCIIQELVTSLKALGAVLAAVRKGQAK